MNESVKDSVEGIQRYVDKCAKERMSGQVVFTLHFRCGGVGRTQVERKEDLPKNGQQPGHRQVRLDNGPGK